MKISSKYFAPPSIWNEARLAKMNVDEIAARLKTNGISTVRLDARFSDDQCAAAFVKDGRTVFVECAPFDSALYRIFTEIKNDSNFNLREIQEIANEINNLFYGVKLLATRVGDVWVGAELLHGSARSFLSVFDDVVERCVLAANAFLARR